MSYRNCARCRPAHSSSLRARCVRWSRYATFTVLAFVGALLGLSPAAAQFVTPNAPVENGPNLPAQPIGPNDLLQISVYGAPEFSRSVRVSDTGFIRLPMLRNRISVLGLMPAELEDKLADALEKAEILVDPAVSVSIAEYHSHPISVVGAVKTPLTFQAVGRTSLVEALTRAQGLSEDAGNEILITRPARNGGPPLIQRVSVTALIDGSNPDLNLMLEGGDEVRVPIVGKVYVVGNVKQPGGFRMDGTGVMTVLKALALSAGLAPYATKVAYVYHRVNGVPQEIPLELQKIMDRKSPDVPLEANDILYVPDNRTKRATIAAVERAVGFAITTTSGMLILGYH